MMRRRIKLHGLTITADTSEPGRPWRVGTYAPTPKLDLAIEQALWQAHWFHRQNLDAQKRGYPSAKAATYSAGFEVTPKIV